MISSGREANLAAIMTWNCASVSFKLLLSSSEVFHDSEENDGLDLLVTETDLASPIGIASDGDADVAVIVVLFISMPDISSMYLKTYSGGAGKTFLNFVFVTLSIRCGNRIPRR